MKSQACFELRDLEISTDIGTYGPHDLVPDKHVLDLILQVNTKKVVIAEDGMAHVFDYDPLVTEVIRLAGDGHYETQERLITRIVEACAAYTDIESVEICLRKSPVCNGSGSLGVRLTVDANTLAGMR